MSLPLLASLFGLALAAFLAATPLPMNSELPFIALQSAGTNPWLLILVAAPANIAGSCITWLCGREADRLKGSRWFPFTPEGLTKSRAWFSRWGRWSLLLSWAPGGDFLVALAGLMRLPFLPFLLLVSLAKTARYGVVALATAGVITGVFTPDPPPATGPGAELTLPLTQPSAASEP